MIKIITDTASLYSTTEGSKLGIEVVPLCVSIENDTYKEFEEISTKELVEKINQGALPTSSQPSIGDMVDAYERNLDYDILHITLADGLSGTYQTAHMARGMIENNNTIHIINSKTLCGPQQHLVDRAHSLAESGMSVEDIIVHLKELIETEHSFLIPKDFNFLKRGGRLTHFAAALGSLIHFTPILATTKDSKRLEKHAIKRSLKSAIKCIGETLKDNHIDSSYQLYVSHGDAIELAEEARGYLSALFPDTPLKVYELSPCLVTQGGPGCLAIQAIKR